MHTNNSMRFFLASLLCLVMISGCKMFSGQRLDESAHGISLKDGPAQKRQPRTLAELTGRSREMPPPAAPDFGPTDANATDGSQTAPAADGSISLDDVSLAASKVHVDAIDIEDLEQDAQEQLPQIVESAVHPFSDMSQPITISDQVTGPAVTDDQPPMHAIQTAQQETPPPTPENTGPQPDSPPAENAVVASPPATTSQTAPYQVPQRSLENLQAQPLLTDRENESQTYQETTPPVMRIVAESEGQRSADRIATATDHLFAETSEPVTKPQGNDSTVAPEQSETATWAQPETVRPVGHQQQAYAAKEEETVGNSIANSAATAQSQQLSLNQQLSAAIQQLDREIKSAGQGASVNQQIRLELLRIAAGEVPAESPTLQSADENLRGYWTHQLNAIGEMLDESDTSATTQAASVAAERRRVTRASEHLELAHSQLADISSMRLQQCAFASEVRGFGQFTRLPSIFENNQEVLIYCEIANYSLRESNSAGKTQKVAELQGQFSIVDANNRIVYQHQYQPVKDYSQRRRKDFYMFFPVTVPNLPVGQYRLQLSVEDLVGNKVASCREDMIFNVSGGTSGRSQPRVAANPPVSQSPTTVPRAERTTAASGNQALPISRYQQPPSPNARIPLPNNGNQPLSANGANQPAPVNQNNMPLPISRSLSGSQPIPQYGTQPSAQRR